MEGPKEGETEIGNEKKKQEKGRSTNLNVKGR